MSLYDQVVTAESALSRFGSYAGGLAGGAIGATAGPAGAAIGGLAGGHLGARLGGFADRARIDSRRKYDLEQERAKAEKRRRAAEAKQAAVRKRFTGSSVAPAWEASRPRPIAASRYIPKTLSIIEALQRR